MHLQLKIGQKLLSAALLDTRRVSYWQLFVDPANESAIRLYTKNGFKKYHKFDDVMDCMIAPAHRK